MKFHAKLCSYPSNSCEHCSPILALEEMSEDHRRHNNSATGNQRFCMKFYGDPLNSHQHILLIVVLKKSSHPSLSSQSFEFNVGLHVCTQFHDWYISVWKKLMGQNVKVFWTYDYQNYLGWAYLLIFLSSPCKKQKSVLLSLKTLKWVLLVYIYICSQICCQLLH